MPSKESMVLNLEAFMALPGVGSRNMQWLLVVPPEESCGQVHQNSCGLVIPAGEASGSIGQKAALSVHGAGCDVVGIVRAEERHHVGDVLRLLDAAQGYASHRVC